MTKTISFELSKRLDELGLLRDVETEYGYAEDLGEIKLFTLRLYHKDWIKTQVIKTLTTDEAMNLLGEYNITFVHIYLKGRNGIEHNHIINSVRYYLEGTLSEAFMFGTEEDELNIEFECYGKEFIEALEYLFTYLLDNNLIGETKLN